MNSPVEAASQGLRRAYLEIVVPTVDDPFIPLLFNPTEYKVEKKNHFAELQAPGLESPLIQWVRGDSEKLTITDLIADTSDTLQDVRDACVDRIRDLMRRNAELHAPPIVRLIWDSEVFRGVIEKLDVTFVLFSPDGVPWRAKLTLTLLEHRPIEEQVAQSLNSPDVEKTWVARRGDTLANVAAAVYADPRQWRQIARANGIADPRRLRPGTVLTVPRLR